MKICNYRSSAKSVLKVPHSSTNILKTSFAYNGSVLWNNHPTDLRFIDNFNILKMILLTQTLFLHLNLCPFNSKFVENISQLFVVRLINVLQYTTIRHERLYKTSITLIFV